MTDATSAVTRDFHTNIHIATKEFTSYGNTTKAMTPVLLANRVYTCEVGVRKIFLTYLTVGLLLVGVMVGNLMFALNQTKLLSNLTMVLETSGNTF